jgi:soluble lytic murein transglycosylase-like protein
VRRASIATAIFLSACAPRPGNAPVDLPDSTAARREIWAALQPMARERGIEPGFVYAIIKLESNFDPRARRGEARGLMQIKPKAWRAVSDLPYEPSVWDWRTNMRVGLDGLSNIKRELVAKGYFSYPLLWASFHYGFDYVAARGFDMNRIDRPSDPISQRLWSGDIDPVAPPR